MGHAGYVLVVLVMCAGCDLSLGLVRSTPRAQPASSYPCPAQFAKPIRLDGGEFWMGTDRPYIPADGEGPAFLAHVAPFAVDPYEEYAAFVEETGYQTDAERFGWSFVHQGMLSEATLASVTQQAAKVPWWAPVCVAGSMRSASRFVIKPHDVHPGVSRQGADWLHPEGPDSNVLESGRGNHPAVHISHADAMAFCAWRNGRLLTEAEFEFAARGGRANRTYAWGHKLMPRNKHRANIWHGRFPAENTADDGFWGTCPVDALGPQNKFGLYNIMGNVWEWVIDPWTVDRSAMVASDNIAAAHEEARAIRARELASETGMSADERVKKGGSFMCHESYCYRYRVAARAHNTADSTAINLGMRCGYDHDAVPYTPSGATSADEAEQEL